MDYCNILSPELAIPVRTSTLSSRSHCAMHLLGKDLLEISFCPYSGASELKPSVRFYCRQVLYSITLYLYASCSDVYLKKPANFIIHQKCVLFKTPPVIRFPTACVEYRTVTIINMIGTRNNIYMQVMRNLFSFATSYQVVWIR